MPENVIVELPEDAARRLADENQKLRATVHQLELALADSQLNHAHAHHELCQRQSVEAANLLLQVQENHERVHRQPPQPFDAHGGDTPEAPGAPGVPKELRLATGDSP